MRVKNHIQVTSILLIQMSKTRFLYLAGNSFSRWGIIYTNIFTPGVKTPLWWLRVNKRTGDGRGKGACQKVPRCLIRVMLCHVCLIMISASWSWGGLGHFFCHIYVAEYVKLCAVFCNVSQWFWAEATLFQKIVALIRLTFRLFRPDKGDNADNATCDLTRYRQACHAHTLDCKPAPHSTISWIISGSILNTLIPLNVCINSGWVATKWRNNKTWSGKVKAIS